MLAMSDKHEQLEGGQPENPIIAFESERELTLALPPIDYTIPLIFHISDFHGNILGALRDRVSEKVEETTQQASPSFTIIYGTRRGGKSSLLHSLEAIVGESAVTIDCGGLSQLNQSGFDATMQSMNLRKGADPASVKVVLIDELEVILDKAERLSILQSLAEKGYCSCITVGFPNINVVEEIEDFSRARGIDYQRINAVSDEPNWVKAARLERWLNYIFRAQGIRVAIAEDFLTDLGEFVGWRPYEITIILRGLMDWYKEDPARIAQGVSVHMTLDAQQLDAFLESNTAHTLLEDHPRNDYKRFIRLLSQEEQLLLGRLAEEGSILSSEQNLLTFKRLLPSEGIDYFEIVQVGNEMMIRPKGAYFLHFLHEYFG